MALTAGSEGASLSDEEIAETLRAIGAAADPTKVLVVAITKDSVHGALVVARQAAEAGFDAVLLTAPSQWERLTEEEVMLYFRAVADGSPLPVVLGSESGSQGYRLSVDEIAELALHGNVIGVYDEGLTMDRYRAIAEATERVRREVLVTTVFAPVTRRMLRGRWDEGGFVSAASLAGGTAVVEAPTVKALKTRTKVVGFQVMAAGCAVGMVELLQAGAAGAMLALSASAPQGCYEAYAAFKDGDPALAAEKGARLVEGCGDSCAGDCGREVWVRLQWVFRWGARLPGCRWMLRGGRWWRGCCRGFGIRLVARGKRSPSLRSSRQRRASRPNVDFDPALRLLTLRS